MRGPCSHDGHEFALQAEGFSASVARPLEATDIDAMLTARPAGRDLEIRMTNEAAETHAVNHVRVLAVPRPEGARVLRAGDRYYPATDSRPPTVCASPAGDCLADVAARDDREYRSRSDGSDLASREVVELAFPAPGPAARGPAGPIGLAIVGRNTLLNTFVFYQALAHMGLDAGEWYLALERGGGEATEALRRVGRVLGDVEAEVLTRRGWVQAGAFSEVGPIAREAAVLPLPADLAPGDVRVRLRMTRGNWKIDQLALVSLGKPVVPVALPVQSVVRDGLADADALARLRDSDRHLLTFPGDAYTLRFTLPEGDHELFLDSRGYYVEWMREQWLTEEDAGAVVALLRDPEATMRAWAPAYRRIEDDMEAVFWKSRIGR